MYRVPIDGGAPSPLSAPGQGDGKASGVPVGFSANALSPDGTLLLGRYWDQKEGRTVAALVDANGRGAARRLAIAIDLGRPDSMAWTPDGRAVTFVKVTGGVPNIWRLPIDGGAATRVTNFTGGDLITTHVWSPDGKWLAMVRSVTARDVVVIKDLRQ
jgi:TolB protein